MPSGGAVPTPVVPFGHQFPPPALFQHFAPQQAPQGPHTTLQASRIKVKRQRQRVDAGEPRNTYQSPFRANRSVFRPPTTTSAPSAVSSALSGVESHFMFGSLTAMLSADGGAWQKPAEKMLVDEEREPEEEAEQENCPEEALQDETEVPATATAEIDELESVELNVEDEEREDSSANTSTPSAAGSSSSRRKSFFPQKQPAPGDDVDDEEEELESDEKGFDAAKEEPEDLSENKTAPSDMAKLQEMAAEQQRRLFSSLLEQQQQQQQKRPEEGAQEKGRVFQQLQQAQTAQIQKDFGRYAQTVKQEMLSQFSGCIDKIFAELATHEAAANNARIAAAVAAVAAAAPPATSQMPELAAQLRLPFMMHPAMYGPYGPSQVPPMSSAPQMLSGGAPMMTSNPMAASSSGIFPPSGFPFNSSLAAISASLRKNDQMTRMSFSPYSAPKKKRSKVTDSARIKSGSVRDTGSSLPASARSSPQLSVYFPPTMVGQSLYGASGFGQEDNDESPMNSDDNSDCGPYDGSAQSSTLTPMHLRKAKLMFFYARYPSSSVLKSYFPDIRFHKNNTAQLVKWFSNFREFYYIQMDKFARQALAEGVRDKEEIVVTADSEIYKLLNQHYNRNNHIQPPESLANVIQKTLQEFFVAIQNGRDAEPSWKKAIYKVINQLDEPIPEYFKNPNFLESLES
uniref:Prospero domain-containing protein n=1 Tax=Steinernema glaseri TaxID=37863 RepID=A0A1I7ZNC1_9BILA